MYLHIKFGRNGPVVHKVWGTETLSESQVCNLESDTKLGHKRLFSSKYNGIILFLNLNVTLTLSSQTDKSHFVY